MHAMRTTAALFLALGLSGALLETGAAESAAAASANTEAGERDSLRGILEGILSKEGISVGGAFRSQFLHSSIGGEGAVPVRRSEESLEFTSVDFDIRARPNTLTQGRLVFRMHQDWRNFFSDIGNPIHTRWISLDGKAGGIFSYNVGDFRKRYSPLTLHSPDIDLLYEPEYYAAQRREAMDEAFLGGNDRLLQGVNLNLDAALENAGVDILPGLHLNLLGSRLRNVETSLGDGSKVTAFTEKWYFEKFLGAGNADLDLPFGFSVGGSHLTIFDKKGSFNPALSGAAGDPDSLAQSTRIWAGRGGFDLAKALGWKDASLSLSGEYASSADDSSWIRITPADSAAGRPLPDTAVLSEDITGSALLAGIQGLWKASKAFSLRGSLNYLRNEDQYRNELAQTPTFRGQRIMNIENDSTPGARALTPQAAQYSTFDALYRHAFKFTPSLASNGGWHKAPFSKNSYDRSIAMQSELASFAATRVDTSLQLVMPFGPATPNRVGIDSRLTAGFWEERIEATVLYAGLKEIVGRRIDSARTLPLTDFAQMGGGLKLEVGAMLGLAYPLTLSGSMVRSTAENGGIAGDTVFTASTVESDFINAGLRYKFWKRAAALGGFQEIRTRNVRAATLEEVQRNVGGGLEYRISDGAYALFGVNQVSVTPPEGALHKEFSQLQTDLRLTVRF